MALRVPSQAGRFVAIFLAVPLLVSLSIILLKIPTSNVPVSITLMIFSVIFLVYEMLWIQGVLDYK